MSVIGYIIQCDLCNAKMLVTADSKKSKFCPDCLFTFIQEAIEDGIDSEEPSTPRPEPVDYDLEYPIGEVRG